MSTKNCIYSKSSRRSHVIRTEPSVEIKCDLVLLCSEGTTFLQWEKIQCKPAVLLEEKHASPIQSSNKSCCVRINQPVNFLQTIIIRTRFCFFSRSDHIYAYWCDIMRWLWWQPEFNVEVGRIGRHLLPSAKIFYALFDDYKRSPREPI